MKNGEPPVAGNGSAEIRPRIEIDEALRKGWCELWYQPKINLKRKCLAGAEAMVRIRHPEMGLLMPGSYQPDVTESSILALAENALVAAVSSWTKFNEAGFNLHLAINVPVNILHRLSVLELVREHRPTDAAWPGFILEVSEEQIIRDVKRVTRIADGLRNNRIAFAIDEFGAGYSSFSALRELPFAELKLDRIFIGKCAVDPANMAICQTTIDLAHRLGGIVVADGIESTADMQALTLMGCDVGQGMLIAPPLPMENFVELLRRRMGKPSPRQDASPAGASAA